MEVVTGPAGYRFLSRPGRPFSAGVAAEVGFEIVRVQFDPLRPLERGGYEAMESAVTDSGRPPAALCAVELRSPEPFTPAGFEEFNRGYVARLERWGLRQGESMAPARTNVAPESSPPSEVSVAAVCFTRVARAGTARCFVISGEADDPAVSGLREKWDAIHRELERRLEALGVGWDDASEVALYAPAGSLGALCAIPGLVESYRDRLVVVESRPPVDIYTLEVDVRSVLPAN
jgi:hypothetical protein